jgi:tetratricopeptide (TPR) repeat protein
MQTSSIVQIFNWISRNFRIVVLGVQLLIPLTILIIGGPKYWGNLIRGATPMSIQEIAAIADIESLDRTYVTTRIKDEVNTGESITWTTRRKGVTVSSETAQFVLAPVGEKLLIVRLRASVLRDGASREVTGELKAISGDLQKSLVLPAQTKTSKTIFPFMLDEEKDGSYVIIGHLGLAISTFFTLLALQTTSKIRRLGRGIAQDNFLNAKTTADQLLRLGIEQNQASKFSLEQGIMQDNFFRVETTADQLLKLGAEQNQASKFSMAEQTLLNALAAYQAMQDQAGVISSLNNLGITYRNLQQFPKAIVCYQQALEVGQQISATPTFFAITLNNLGIAYNSHSDFQKALKSFQTSLPFYQQIGDRRGEANATLNMGISNHYLNHPQQAHDFFQQAIQIAHSLGDLELEVSFRQLIVSLPR